MRIVARLRIANDSHFAAVGQITKLVNMDKIANVLSEKGIPQQNPYKENSKTHMPESKEVKE